MLPVAGEIDQIVDDIGCRSSKAERDKSDERVDPRLNIAGSSSEDEGDENKCILRPLMQPDAAPESRGLVRGP